MNIDSYTGYQPSTNYNNWGTNAYQQNNSFSQNIFSNTMNMQQPQQSSSMMMQLMMMILPLIMQRQQAPPTNTTIDTGVNVTLPGVIDQMDHIQSAKTLRQYFDIADTAEGGHHKDGLVSFSDLQALNSQKGLPADLLSASRYLQNNKSVFTAIETSEGNGKIDNLASKSDIDVYLHNNHY